MTGLYGVRILADTYNFSVTHDCILPLSTPITGIDGRRMETIPVPKGCEITIAISAANHNKAVWGDDALEFKPQRWLNGRAQGVTVRMSGVYGNTMTFVGGGRSCMCVLLPPDSAPGRLTSTCSGFKFVQLELSTWIFIAALIVQCASEI